MQTFHSILLARLHVKRTHALRCK